MLNYDLRLECLRLAAGVLQTSDPTTKEVIEAARAFQEFLENQPPAPTQSQPEQPPQPVPEQPPEV